MSFDLEFLIALVLGQLTHVIPWGWKTFVKFRRIRAERAQALAKLTDDARDDIEAEADVKAAKALEEVGSPIKVD